MESATNASSIDDGGTLGTKPEVAAHEPASAQDVSAPDSASTLTGVPGSPTAGQGSGPQVGIMAGISSAGSNTGSDTASQLVDTLHIVATDRNAVDKFDLYEIFSVQDGFQRIAWQNDGPCCLSVLRLFAGRR